MSSYFWSELRATEVRLQRLAMTVLLVAAAIFTIWMQVGPLAVPSHDSQLPMVEHPPASLIPPVSITR